MTKDIDLGYGYPGRKPDPKGWSNPTRRADGEEELPLITPDNDPDPGRGKWLKR